MDTRRGFVKKTAVQALFIPDELRQTLRNPESGKIQQTSAQSQFAQDSSFLDGCIYHILSINKTNIEIQQGNFSSWLASRERQDSFELRENEKLKNEIRHLEQTAREKAAWSDTTERRKIGFEPPKRIKYRAAPMRGPKPKR